MPIVFEKGTFCPPLNKGGVRNIDLYLLILFVTNILLTACLYVYVGKKSRLVGFQLGMNISIIAGGFTAVSTGIVLIMIYPFFYTSVTILSVLIGLIAGGAFGLLFDYQTALTGYVNGLMMGLMAPMVGALIDNQLMFLTFLEILLVSSYFAVLLSVRRS
ncbi:hypothetical protein [Bacillus sp. AK031]